MASHSRPTRLDHALAMLADRPHTLLAGGTDHFPARAIFEPEEDILDLTALQGLRAITHEAGTWRIPALATWSDVADAALPPLFAGLQQAARQVGGRQIQNAGTLVGNVCNASPAADGMPPLLALDAAIELRSATGRRILPLHQFVQGPRRTARRADEIATALLVPHTDATSRFLKLGARRYLVISIGMVAITLVQHDDGRIAHAAIAVGACGPVATRLRALEAALQDQWPGPGLVRPEHMVPLRPIDDVRATAGYRAHAALELIRRGLAGFAAPSGACSA